MQHHERTERMERTIFRSYLAKCLSRCHMMSLDKNGTPSVCVSFSFSFSRSFAQKLVRPFCKLFYLLLFAFIMGFNGRKSLFRTMRINSQSTILNYPKIVFTRFSLFGTTAVCNSDLHFNL